MKVQHARLCASSATSWSTSKVASQSFKTVAFRCLPDRTLLQLTKLTLDFADLRSDRISLLSHDAADPGPNSMSMLRNMVPGARNGPDPP